MTSLIRSTGSCTAIAPTALSSPASGATTQATGRPSAGEYRLKSLNTTVSSPWLVDIAVSNAVARLEKLYGPSTRSAPRSTPLRTE